jgi:hypothetical protein
MRGLRRLILLAVVPACGSPSLRSGEIACGPGDSCPDGMTCARELCWTDPPGEWDAAPADDAPPPDAGLVAEHVREAESYDQLTPLPGTTGSAEWREESELADASGGAYLIALPNDGVDCLDEPPTDCGALVVYDLPAMVPGTYFLHLSTAAAGPMDDSLFYGVDGALIDFADLPDGLAWAWRRQTLGVLDGAGHSITIWVREDGAAIDRLVVSQSAASPE